MPTQQIKRVIVQAQAGFDLDEISYCNAENVVE